MCAIVHEGAARPALARIQVTFDEFPSPTASPTGEPVGAPIAVEEPAAAARYVSGTVCLQCADAPCIPACPTGALARDAQTGAIAIDVDPDSATACMGCMRCRKACPWDVPRRHPEIKVAVKCDLCAGREGGPACVQMCPLSGKALRVASEALAADADAAPGAVGQAASVTLEAAP
jgi:Fe-S-cluster-containing dehydrogenase component